MRWLFLGDFFLWFFMDGLMMDVRSHNSIIEAQEKKGLKI
jgi:hypothetical protein